MCVWVFICVTWLIHMTATSDVLHQSHVTHRNESCHTYEWVMSHMEMSHVTHMNELCHTYEYMRCSSHMNEPLTSDISFISVTWLIHMWWSHLWMSHLNQMEQSTRQHIVGHMNDSPHAYRASCYTHESVRHVWMSHVTHEYVELYIGVTHMNESRHTWMCHVTHEWVTSHMNVSSCTYELHTWMCITCSNQRSSLHFATHMDDSPHTHEWVVLHMNESRRTHKSRHITDMNESCHTHGCVMSQIGVSLVTRMNGSYHRFQWVILVAGCSECGFAFPHTWMMRITHKVPSCYRHQRGTRQRLERVTSQTRMGHVIDMNESRHTRECVMS